MPATKHTQHAPSTKTECDYLNGWIKKRSHTQKSHPKVVNPRDIAGERKKKKKKKKNCPADVAGFTDDNESAGRWANGASCVPYLLFLVFVTAALNKASV